MFARRTSFSSFLLVGVFFGLLALAAPAAAQLTTGTLTGTLKDPQGGVIPGATVTVTSEAKGTQMPPAFTGASGDFTVANMPPDTYTIQIAMQGFKTLKRSGIAVSAGDRVGLGVLTIELGGLAESVTVQAESPLVQTQSGERSFTVATKSVESLPISNRSFVQLATLAPGVGSGNNPGRIGGGGANNVMMDGISTMDTGSNAILLQMNVESIAEVKVLVSNYQAEYGRSSGLQISAVTKSGTNRFRGSAYDVMRRDGWNANSKTNLLNGDPKAKLNEKDLGYSIGGPIGKPGGNNKLFFFYSHEFAPRTFGGEVSRFRVPTALERAGDFSQTTDNNGNLFNAIKDPLLTATCSPTNSAGCFQSGGVVGRIPADRLYGTGLNILKLYPMPNVTSAPGSPYNYEKVRPIENLIANQPALRVDYQPWPTLRGTFKYSGWGQKNTTIAGSIPGFNDTRQYKPVVGSMAVTVNYNLNSTTFVEGTWGHAQNELTGCALAQGGTGPSRCTSAFPMNDSANLTNAGLGGLPFLFPNAGVINPDYYAFKALQSVNPPIWDGTRISMVPSFTWGSRVANAPPNVPFPGYLNINSTNDISINLTKIAGRHTFKTGFYRTHSYKAQQRGGWAGALTFSNDTSNPLDSGFGFANAALGIFAAYNQVSRYVEGQFVYDNVEAFVQDNWKVNGRLTFDYGVRFVHQQPQYDKLGQASNFLPEKWSLSSAPVLYLAGCAAQPCTGVNRQARDPRTNQLLGPNTAVAIGTLVPNSGSASNGLFLSGNGIAETTYTWPMLALAPRFGMAYDVTGKQSIILRGGAGLFYDRPSGNSIYSQVQNPPTIRDLTLRYGQLQTLSTGLTTEAPPALNVFNYKSGLPSSWQWNGGIQKTLPWASVVDFEYVGQHSYNTLEGVNINAVDFGAAYLPANQDTTISSATPGAAAVQADQMRGFRGYSTITQQVSRGWRTFHSLQLSFNRRFKDGLAFGFNDTIPLYDHQSTGARLQHNADGTYSERADQKEADELLGTSIANKHILKGNFVWDLPDVHGSGTVLKTLGLLTNDWQLSGVWTASTGGAYAIGVSYQGGATGNGSQNITGSPNYGGRTLITGDPGSGCSGDTYRQFNTSAFAGPKVGSLGLESGAGYMRGCFNSALDMTIARTIRLGGGRQFQLRVDAFNAFNQGKISGRNTNLSVASPIDGTPANLPFDASGNLIVSRSLPKNAGFGVVNDYQNPRTLQAQIRFSF